MVENKEHQKRTAKRREALNAGQRRRLYSQNILPLGSQVVTRLIEAADIDSGKLVVEIGAGQGSVTAALAEIAETVVSYEIDRAMYERALTEVAGKNNISIVLNDVRNEKPPREPFQVVANIPFGITSDIIQWCLNAELFDSGTFITQLEYARKRTGYYKRWTKVTVLSWPRFEWQMLGVVKRQEFRPQPKVDAGILSIRRRAAALIADPSMRWFERLVEVGFRGVGGSVDKSLSQVLPRQQVMRAMERAGVERGTAVGYVSPDQWVTIVGSLPKQGPGGRQTSSACR